MSDLHSTVDTAGEARRDRGRSPARERIEAPVDRGSPLLELWTGR